MRCLWIRPGGFAWPTGASSITQRLRPSIARLIASVVRSLTTNYILAELVALLTSPKHIPRASVIAFIRAIKANPQVEVVHLDAALDEQAWQLLIDR